MDQSLDFKLMMHSMKGTSKLDGQCETNVKTSDNETENTAKTINKFVDDEFEFTKMSYIDDPGLSNCNEKEEHEEHNSIDDKSDGGNQEDPFERDMDYVLDNTQTYMKQQPNSTSPAK